MRQIYAILILTIRNLKLAILIPDKAGRLQKNKNYQGQRGTLHNQNFVRTYQSLMCMPLTTEHENT